MNLRLVCLVALASGAIRAEAAPLCDQLAPIFAQGVGSETSMRFELEGVTAKCSRSLSIGGQSSLNCSWAYGFRSDAATSAFAMLSTSVEACMHSGSTGADQPVSHPDFYDLRLFRSALGEAGVSLKDKGALQQTYVFLRITPAL